MVKKNIIALIDYAYQSRANTSTSSSASFCETFKFTYKVENTISLVWLISSTSSKIFQCDTGKGLHFNMMIPNM